MCRSLRPEQEVLWMDELDVLTFIETDVWRVIEREVPARKMFVSSLLVTKEMEKTHKYFNTSEYQKLSVLSICPFFTSFTYIMRTNASAIVVMNTEWVNTNGMHCSPCWGISVPARINQGKSYINYFLVLQQLSACQCSLMNTNSPMPKSSSHHGSTRDENWHAWPPSNRHNRQDISSCWENLSMMQRLKMRASVLGKGGKYL